MTREPTEHERKWRHATYEEVAGQTVGHLADPPNAQSIELTANIKRGAEVVLGGVASMPDVMAKIIQLRPIQNSIIRTEKTIVSEFNQAFEGNGADDPLYMDWKDYRDEAMAVLHEQFKMTRMELGNVQVTSLKDHILLETAAVEGERAKQLTEINKVQVSRDLNGMEQLEGMSRNRRSLRHPLGK